MTFARAIKVTGNPAQWHETGIFDAQTGKMIPDVKRIDLEVRVGEPTQAMLYFADGSTEWCRVPPNDEPYRKHAAKSGAPTAPAEPWAPRPRIGGKHVSKWTTLDALRWTLEWAQIWHRQAGGYLASDTASGLARVCAIAKQDDPVDLSLEERPAVMGGWTVVAANRDTYLWGGTRQECRSFMEGARMLGTAELIKARTLVRKLATRGGCFTWEDIANDEAREFCK